LAEPAASRVTEPTIFFQLDRFERLDGDRLEVSGRWFGIRGRRFVRPTLTLVAGGERVRALAELDHKPWAADDGEDWEAAFIWDGEEEIEDAELAVAPDLAVRLPRPGAELDSPERLVPYGAVERRDGKRPQSVRPARPRSGSSAAAAPTRERRPSAREREHVREIERLREELERAESLLREAASQREELNRELERVTQLESDVREAQAAAEVAQRSEQQVIAERDAAVAQRDAAFAERDRLRIERDRAVGERDWLAVERDELLAERTRALESPARSAVPAAPITFAPEAEANWVQRGIALAVLCTALIALAIVAHVF